MVLPGGSVSPPWLRPHWLLPQPAAAGAAGPGSAGDIAPSQHPRMDPGRRLREVRGEHVRGGFGMSWDPLPSAGLPGAQVTDL